MIQINKKTCFSLADILGGFSPDMLRLYTYPLLREKLHSTKDCEEIANEVDGLVKTKQKASEFVRYACLVKAFSRGDVNRSSEVLSSYIRGNLPVLTLDNLRDRLLEFMPSDEDASCLSSFANTYGEYFQALSELRNVVIIGDGFSDNYESLLAIMKSSAILGAVDLTADVKRKIEELETAQMVQKSFELALHDQNMVRVAGGTFKMGSTDSDADDDEETIHDVTLSDYYICQHTVTQQQWQKIKRKNPSYFKGDTLPVEEVSWYGCVEYCNALSRHYGLKECYRINGTTVSLLNGGRGGFRLPTEAEWEFAARGGKMSRNFKYAGSDNLDEVAWYDGNSNSKTHPVCQKKRNELGLYDMSGNVWEWCWDRYDSYPSSPQSNPLGASSGSSCVRRGGSWSNSFTYCRVSYRNYDAPGYRNNFLGLRLVLAL